ncbi:MAG: DUF350 domain-containing protein [Anaerolineae bacterium]
MALVSAVLRILVVAAAAGVALYVALWLFDRLTPGISEWQEIARGNAAVGAVMASVVLAVAIVVWPTVAFPLSGLDLRIAEIPAQLAAEGVRILLGMGLAVGSVALSAWLYNRFTGPIDERTELQRGNLAVGLVQSAVILGTAALLSSPSADFVRLVLEAVFR